MERKISTDRNSCGAQLGSPATTRPRHKHGIIQDADFPGRIRTLDPNRLACRGMAAN
jgi:hypothetical protein